MKRVQIHNGDLVSVGYNAELQVLEVELSGHNVFQFVRVSEAVYVALMNAPQQYEYFKANIQEKYLVQKI